MRRILLACVGGAGGARSNFNGFNPWVLTKYYLMDVIKCSLHKTQKP